MGEREALVKSRVGKKRENEVKSDSLEIYKGKRANDCYVSADRED